LIKKKRTKRKSNRKRRKWKLFKKIGI